ncbi:MAG: tRNA lysidine(34) synthetase TilS [Pseudomonadota bacterium]
MLSSELKLDGLSEQLSPLWGNAKNLISKQQTAILAVSGGPDSMAMLVGFAILRASGMCDTQFLVATVDHDLREGSADDVALVMKVAKLFGLPVVANRLSPEKRQGNLHDWARRSRYSFFARLSAAASNAPILTAHTQDDQAETFLMRAARGTGADGLSAIRSSIVIESQPVLRPFLTWPKQVLRDTLQIAGVQAAIDPSNNDARFTRSRFRRWLEAAPRPDSGRSIVAGFAESAIIAQQEAEALRHYAQASVDRIIGMERGYACGPLDRSVPSVVLARAVKMLVDGIRRKDEPAQQLDLARALWVAQRLSEEETGAWVGCGAALRWGKAKGTNVSPQHAHIELYAEAGRSGFPSQTFKADENGIWDHRFAVINGSSQPVMIRPWSPELAPSGGASPHSPTGLSNRVARSLPVACSLDDGQRMIAAPWGLEAVFGIPKNDEVSIRFGVVR